MPLSDDYITLLRSSQANVFYDPRKSSLLGELVDSGVKTYWFKDSAKSSRDAALDIASLLGSLGFTLSDSRGGMRIIPEEFLMTGGWTEALNALAAVQGTVDLLNDEDRLLSD